MLKLLDNPPMLSPEAGSLFDLHGRWWVAHTKARFEKAFAWDLLHQGIGYFLPMVDRVKMSSGKKRRVLLPLFPSYVFFCGTDEQRYLAKTTNRICQTIEVVDQDGLVKELGAIERAIVGKAKLDPYPFATVGRRCRIIAGAFKGLEGVVIDYGRQSRIVLQINILGQGAAMEIDTDLLEPIE